METGKEAVSPKYAIDNDATWAVWYSQMWNILRAKALWIVSGSLAMGALAALFSFFMFQDAYQSSAKLMLNTGHASSLLARPEVATAFLKNAELESSSYKNQEELLKSQLIYNRVFKQIQKAKIKTPYQRPADLAEHVLRAEHIKNTNFIRISAIANKPSTAQKLAEIYLKSYMDLVREISRKPIQKEKKALENQLQQAKLALVENNHQMAAYPLEPGSPDLSLEKRNSISQLVNLDVQCKSTRANLAQKRAEVIQLRNRLKLKSGELTSAIQAVAIGQDHTLIALQEKLQDLQKDYAVKALIYAPTNPDMIQIQRKLDVLKSQITDQQILTIGYVPTGKISQIKDSLRADLIRRLAIADSERAALQNKLGALQAQYQGRKATLKNLPQQQIEYTRLLLEKKNKADLLARIKQNLADVSLQETAFDERLMVIDPPDLPERPVAPLRWQLITGAVIAGLLLPLAAVAIYSVFTRRQPRPAFVEQILDAPVLGSIPWLSMEKWRYLRNRGRLEMVSNETDPTMIKAYQDLAINLKARRSSLQKNTVVFSQLLDEKGHSVILANLAFCLAQGGDRVLLIDADLHRPGLHEAFNHALDYEQSLPELINSVSELLHRKQDVQVQDILSLVSAVATPSGIHPQLEYLNAGLVLGNTFEFLNSKSVDLLLSVLKAGYDWVLISAPPLLKYPDGAVLLGYADGLLLLADQELEKSHLIAARNKIERIGATAYGVILRDATDI